MLDMIASSSTLMTVLHALRATNRLLWLGGGAVRNHVWDRLTNRTTPHDDFDVVYFNATDIDPASDAAIEAALSLLLPRDLKISVKNQARMHLITGEPVTASLNDAIANWPETATAVAIRLGDTGRMELIAPYGLGDLLDMVVRPSPYHAAHPASFRRRLLAKQWRGHWPELRLESAATVCAVCDTPPFASIVRVGNKS